MADALIAALPNSHFLFTSESVGEAHPDKICDQVADAIVDMILAEDRQAKVGIEVCLKGDMLVVLGAVCTPAQVPYEQAVRQVIKKLGYDGSGKGLGPDSCRVVVHVEQQSSEVAIKAAEDVATGDQGNVFGYATNETPECMPLSHSLATRLTLRLTELVGTCRWARADSLVQVTMEYKRTRGKVVPSRVHTVALTVGFDSDTSLEDLKTQIREQVVKPVVPEQYLDDRTVYVISPANRGTGMTGQRLNADSYGGWGAHGGGSLAGKDPAKVDRCGAYAARWVAKSLVKGCFCDRVLVQIAYGIGLNSPLSVNLDTFGTGKGGREDKDLLTLVLRNFDLRPESIVRELNLRQCIYQKTAANGHFGRDNDSDFTWELPRDLPHAQ